MSTVECESGKIMYPSRATALKAMKRLKQKGQFGLNVYVCAKCHGFHIGRKSRRFT